MAEPTVITDDTFEEEVISSSTPVLVDFWATWCMPCQMIAPVLKEVATEYEGQLKVAKLDVDQNPQTAGQYGVMSIPTLILF
ncbi:MAG: thioredoxin, partial [Chloroflexota bacterium]|nr:thioredoxin [Chloroflexota bacterium]